MASISQFTLVQAGTERFVGHAVQKVRTVRFFWTITMVYNVERHV
jgi:hypothetical protein